MPVIYEIDSNGYFTGTQREIAMEEGCPPPFVRADAPEIPEGMFAVFKEGWWEYTDVPPSEVLEFLPAEIAMHKVRKALKRLGPLGVVAPEDYETDSWWYYVMTVIATLPARQKDEILDELNTAPNMVLAGASTLMIANAIGMSPAQLEEVGRLALTLT